MIERTEMYQYIEQFDAERLLRDLIRLDTQNPPGNERCAIDYVDRIFAGTRAERRILSHGENRASLIVKIPGGEEEALAFIGHVDTVPIGNEKEWTKPPLAGVREGNLLYGRGTSDMKSGIAAMLMTARFVLEKEILLPYDLFFVFTADEESGSMGIEAVRESGLVPAHKVVIPEPTDNRLSTMEKGSIWVKLHAYGKSAHGAMPGEGINAIDMLFTFIARFRKRFLENKEESTISLTVFEGGEKINVVPSYANAVLDIRTTMRTEHEQCRLYLQQLVREMCAESGIYIEKEIVEEHFPCFMTEETEMVRGFAEICREMTGEEKTVTTVFYTDLEKFVAGREEEIAFVIMGPGQVKAAHKVDESVDIEEVKKAAKMYLRYLLGV